jgi:hypothetical protein
LFATQVNIRKNNENTIQQINAQLKAAITFLRAIITTTFITNITLIIAMALTVAIQAIAAREDEQELISMVGN